jgi:Zn-dependent protease
MTQGRGFRLGSLLGIELRVDAGLLVVFWLVTLSLGASLFPARHPEWSAALRWGVAVTAAILFFVSVLLHEMSHALVARHYGIPVRSITLFIFGGVASLEREPPSPKAELLVAAVGPLTSIAIGLSCTALALGLIRHHLGASGVSLDAFTRQAPLETLLLWLGPVNVMLGLFNLVPGFPLDGGRILRAALWAGTGNLTRATRYASMAGQLFAWTLIALGAMMAFGLTVPWLGSGLVNGLWLAFIGWYLKTAAISGYQQRLVQDLLEDVPVTRLMRPGAVTISPDLTLQQLMDVILANTDESDSMLSPQPSPRAFPVVDGGRLVGIIGLADLRRVPRPEWPHTRVDQVMSRELSVVTPGESAATALQRLSERDLDQLPVVEGGVLRGVLRRNDILRWLQLQAQTST